MGLGPLGILPWPASGHPPTLRETTMETLLAENLVRDRNARLTERFDLNVIDLTGDYSVDGQAEAFGPRLYERDPKMCCELNKVVPFTRALRGYDAWMTSMRRDSAWTRKNTPIVSQTKLEDGGKSLVRV